MFTASEAALLLRTRLMSGSQAGNDTIQPVKLMQYGAPYPDLELLKRCRSVSSFRTLILRIRCGFPTELLQLLLCVWGGSVQVVVVSSTRKRGFRIVLVTWGHQARTQHKCPDMPSTVAWPKLTSNER